MHVLSPEQIQARSTDRAACTTRVDLQPVDFSRPFIPERFTQLYYTPFYPHLTRPQRLRYNQLFAVRVSEQFMAFEQDFTNRVLARIVHDPRIDPRLAECLVRMMGEEESHQRMFRELNAHCLPELFGADERSFTRLGRIEAWAFSLATAISRRLPFLLFFIIALEEYSTALSRAMIKERETELGPLEENFVHVHAEHVKDESRHVHLDVHVIRALYAKASWPVRTFNAALLAAFLREILVPKRSGLAVLRRLVFEHPELKPSEAAMADGLRALAHDEGFQKSLFNREVMPHTFALFDAQPELAVLRSVLKGYRRG